MGVEPRFRIGPFVMSGWGIFLLVVILIVACMIMGLIQLG